MYNKLKLITIFLALTASALAFQNCGADFNPDEYSLSLESQGLPLVNQPPKITSVSNPGTVNYASNATLSVIASGDNLQYQWYKDGVMLSGAVSASYQITSAVEANKGSYSVMVSNPYGQVNSSALVLNVVNLPVSSGPPVIVSKTGKLILPFFSSVAVPLSVTATGVGLTYSWVLIAPAYTTPPSTTTTVLPDKTSQIMTTRSSFDAGNGTVGYYVNVGTYRVTVTNSYGESVSADIVVEFEPLVIGI